MTKSVFAFAYIILRPGSTPTELLVVQRSPNDRYFPGMWGLPAGTLRKRENHDEGIRRTARLRLGIEVEELGELAAGSSDRRTHVVEMRLFEGRIIAGSPQVRATDPDGFGYMEVCWARPEILQPARERGSLCCRLADDWLRTFNSSTE